MKNHDLAFYSYPHNCFKHSIASPLVIFHPDWNTLKERIFNDLDRSVFKKINKPELLVAMEKICKEELGRGNNIRLIERKIETRLCNEVFRKSGVLDLVHTRAFRISEQIQKAIEICHIPCDVNQHYMDIGCGSGMVAKYTKDKYGFKNTALVDVVDYRYKEVRADKSLKFQLFQPPFKKLQPPGNFDLITITNVLHHSNHPFTVFETANRYLKVGGHIIVIESCIGLHEGHATHYHPSKLIPHQTVFDDTGKITEDYESYIKLDFKDKMQYGIFFDWLYNRTFVNENINVPYNFGTPEQWNSEFSRMGCEVLDTYFMGIDQPSVLEYHTMHVLKKT